MLNAITIGKYEGMFQRRYHMFKISAENLAITGIGKDIFAGGHGVNTVAVKAESIDLHSLVLPKFLGMKPKGDVKAEKEMSNKWFARAYGMGNYCKRGKSKQHKIRRGGKDQLIEDAMMSISADQRFHEKLDALHAMKHQPAHLEELELAA